MSSVQRVISWHHGTGASSVAGTEAPDRDRSGRGTLLASWGTSMPQERILSIRSRAGCHFSTCHTPHDRPPWPDRLRRRRISAPGQEHPPVHGYRGAVGGQVQRDSGLTVGGLARGAGVLPVAHAVASPSLRRPGDEQRRRLRGVAGGPGTAAPVPCKVTGLWDVGGICGATTAPIGRSPRKWPPLASPPYATTPPPRRSDAHSAAAAATSAMPGAGKEIISNA